VVLLLPQLRTASQKYVNIVLDKRKTLLLQRKDPSATVSKLPEAPSLILEGAAGAEPTASITLALANHVSVECGAEAST
jgi:hypothetical protein